MVRNMRFWSATVALLMGLGVWGAANAQQETKELDKLEGYDQLRGEKGVKKALTGVPKQAIESLIIWSDAKPTSGSAPLTVEFTADPPQGAKNPAFTWDFGDGSAAAQGQKVSHTYQKAGLYRALLKVTDASGDLGMDEQRIKVGQ